MTWARERTRRPGSSHIVVTETANGVHVVDIWESAADVQRFNQEQLMPSMKRVTQERGIQLPDPFPEPKITEAYDLVRGS